MMRPMQGGGNHEPWKFLLVGDNNIRMMEQDEHQLNGLHRQHNVRINANQNNEQTFIGDLDKEVEHMEPKAGRQVKGFITMMNLVESPEKIVMVIYHMPT